MRAKFAASIFILMLCGIATAHAQAPAAAPAASQAQAAPQAQAPTAPPVPVVKGDSGSCTADFVVHDASGKGIYNAMITLHVEWGFLGLHKLDLMTNTNADGKARVEGLPEKPRKPAEFKISYGSQNKSVPYDPFGHCMAEHELTFDTTPQTKPAP